MASLSRNVSNQNVTFCLVNASSGQGLAGATVTVYVTKDGGLQAAGGGTVTSQGNGQYNYVPTQAETNAIDVGFLFIATNAIPVNIDFHTDIISSNGYIEVDVEYINNNALAAQALKNSTNSIVWGTVSSGSPTTAVVATLNNPSSLTDTNQLVGRTIIFLGSTTSGHLQSQASNIIGNTTGATPTITYSAMTAAPANGDVFVIL